MSGNGRWSRRAFLATCGGVALAGCTSPTRTGTTTERPGSSTDETTTNDGDGSTSTTDRTGTSPPPERISIAGDLSWTMAGNGPTNAGYVSTTGPDRDPGRVWDVQIDGVYTIPSPAYREGTCYVGSGKKAYSIAVEEGEKTWTTELDYLTHHYPCAITDDHLLMPARTMTGARAGGGEGALYAIDPAEGTIDWQFERPISSGPKVVEDGIFVTSSADAGVIHALDRSGEERWRFEYAPENARTASAFGEPAVVGDTVFATTTAHRSDGTGDGVVFALAREDGSVRWRHETGVETRAAPLVDPDRGVVYAATAGGTIHALDAASGDPVWEHSVGKEILTTPVMDDRSAYVLASGDVVAVDRAAGERQWRTDIGVSRMNGLAVTDGGVYVGGTDVTALNADGGEIRWKYPIPGQGGEYGAPIVLDGVVLVGACIKKTRSSMYDDHMFALA